MKISIKIIALIIFGLVLFGTSYAQKDNKDRSVKLKSFPQPGYTKEAQTERIEGEVILRVTFLANGKIGDIKEIPGENKSEMRKTGLVDQAIEAAKKMKFTPAVKDGKAVAVTKTVKYTFTLY